MRAPLRPLVVTGASGFVGRRFVERLRSHDVKATTASRRVTLIARDPRTLDFLGPLPEGWRIVTVDIAREAVMPGIVESGSVVVHLAAATGRLSPALMRLVNVEGTARLLDAARAAGAAHFILVSSIAARFEDRRWYHYADAKREAEQRVVGGGVAYTIVRPTMVFGAGSPVQEGLEQLALGGAPIVLGSGDVQVQPIFVDDLADVLLSLALSPPDGAQLLEVGGADRISLRELLARMRAAHALPPRTPWSIPLALPRRLLGMAESLVGTRLPITAGQLASFVNDSSAMPSDVVGHLLPTPRGVAMMLADPSALGSPTESTSTTRHPSTSTNSSNQLAREFVVFARYLGTPSPGPREAAAYARAQASVVAAGAADTFDEWLVTVAGFSAVTCALADAYSRLARPYGTLRRKLVLTLAVLESSSDVHAAYDTARHSSAAIAGVSIVALGIAWATRTLLAVALFAPLHLATALVRKGATHG